MAQEKRPPKAGEYYRVNFSRVQWDVDVIDGKYVKRTDEEGRVLPENNWVWAPTGVINIHYPELWGFVFFTEGSEEYEIPAAEYVSWELRKLYYYEHVYCDSHGRFTEDIEALAAGLDVHVETVSHGFEAYAFCPEADRWLMIREDGLLTVYTPEEWEM